LVLGIPFEFLILGFTLIGVAIFHEHPLTISLGGLAALVVLKWSQGFDFYPHLHAELALICNLFGLLLGFAILARHFEDSRLPDFMPRLLPDNWTGAFLLLVLVFILSSFLDNIAAALIGGTVAFAVFQGRVHIGYLVALTAASNAGGAGSVLGDTTTTMLWIAGVPATKVLHAYIGSGMALLCFGIPAALQQHRYQSILHDPMLGLRMEWKRIILCGVILIATALANIWMGFPALGVWAVLLLSLPIIPMPWKILPSAARGATMLSALVLCASLMPVESLPTASWASTLALGYISACFDNIPLTRLALEQGNYDWGVLAYAVGYGGSMLWFGSSAGVALSGRYPQVRSTGLWLRHGWHVVIAYPIGFAVLLAIWGWHP
jgi:Na+/H+ antiporter NhaD/arsenite permease-like protein